MYGPSEEAVLKSRPLHKEEKLDGASLKSIQVHKAKILIRTFSASL